MAMKWNKKDVMLMLELYMKYKDDFRGQGHKNLKIWQQIAWEMTEKGMKVDYVRMDRKLRNMKRTYMTIKMKLNTTHEAPNWPFYDAMDKIFGRNLSQSFDLTTSEEDETVCEQKMEVKEEPYVCEQKMEVKEEPYVFANELMDEINFTEFISDRTTNEDQDVDVDSPYVNLAEELESQRLEELRAIRITLQEANLIQKERNQILEERNELMRQYLSATLKK